MKKYLFKKGQWEKDFEYVYSLVAKSYTEFTQEQDCLANSFNQDINFFNYVSVCHKEKQKTGVCVSAVASFDSFGAPLITFANSITTDENGYKLYGDHYEVVFYEDGCNVWLVTKAPENSEEKHISTLCGELHFKIEDKKKVALTVVVKEGYLEIDIDGRKMQAPTPLLLSEFFVGITACEGINRFYSAEIK